MAQSKASVLKKWRQTLSEHKDQTIDSNHKQFDYFQSICGSGPIQFKIRPNRRSGHEVLQLYKNGFERTFSIYSYLLKRNKPNGSYISKGIQQARLMRQIISDQIQQFRFTHQSNPCAICHQTDQTKYEVDHFPVSFAELKQEYFKNHKDINDWYQFHQNHATLRWLCLDCHFSGYRLTEQN